MRYSLDQSPGKTRLAQRIEARRVVPGIIFQGNRAGGFGTGVRGDLLFLPKRG
jgi:hypothetical protein